MDAYIVDKNNEFLEKVKRFLKKYNITVKVFYKVGEFQKYFLFKKPDIVICNPVISGLSPFFIVKWIRENSKNLPVIAYIEKPTKEFILLAKTYKVNSLLIYPFKVEELLDRIKKLLKIDLKIASVNLSEQAIRKERIKNEILLQLEKLPSFPAIVQEIENLINRHDSNARDFEEVIKKDQVITAKVLKIVNSPFYSLARKFTTISESVAYIGLDALRSIVYSASVSNILKGSFEAYGYKKDQLWKHSYTTAFIARNLAEHLKLEDKIKEELFVSGLIHDIGKIILSFIAKKEKVKFVNNNGSNILEIEKEYFLFSHCEVGGMVADKWRLPEIHKSNILMHHTPENFNNKIIYTADSLSKYIVEIDDNEEKIIDDFNNFLNINFENYKKIKEDILQTYEKVEKEGIF